jgi:hypothetical protein
MINNAKYALELASRIESDRVALKMNEAELNSMLLRLYTAIGLDFYKVTGTLREYWYFSCKSGEGAPYESDISYTLSQCIASAINWLEETS